VPWGKWGRLRHEGNWLGPKKNGAQCPKPLYYYPITDVGHTYNIKIEGWADQ